jgi:hypothetical protein
MVNTPSKDGRISPNPSVRVNHQVVPATAGLQSLRGAEEPAELTELDHLAKL